MVVDRVELLDLYNSLRQRVHFDLPPSAQLNVRLFVYECIHIIKNPSISNELYYDALNLVDLQDEYKFQIIADTLKLLIVESENISEVRLYTNNAMNFLKHLQDKVYQENYFDSLTGVFNYNYLQKIESEISAKDFTLFFFDLDGLKKINDLYGHEHGNKLIQNFAKILKSSFRFDDLVIRYGGDEFIVIVFRNKLNPDKAIEKLNKHPQMIELNIAFSFGFSRNNEKNLKKTLSIADQLMYTQKESK